jgi:hypothetical protein
MPRDVLSTKASISLECSCRSSGNLNLVGSGITLSRVFIRMTTRGSPHCHRGATSLSGSKEWFENCSFVVLFGYSIYRFDGIFHEFEAVGVCLNSVWWHPTPAGCKHAEVDYDSIITGGGIIVESGDFVLLNSAEIIVSCVKRTGSMDVHYGTEPC